MAQLTWRNVDAPSGSASQQGIRDTAALFGNAANSLSQGLAGFGKAQQDQTTAAVLQNALRYTDPTSYQQALQSGALTQGIDPTNLTPEALRDLSARSTDLLNNATQQSTLDYRNYGLDRTKTLDANSDAAAPIIAQINAAYAQGNRGLGDQLTNSNQALLGRLTPEQTQTLNNNNAGLNTRQLSDTGQQLRNSASQFELGKDMTNYGRQETANRIQQDLISSTFSPADKLAKIEQYNSSPGADPAVTALLRAANPGLYGGGAPGGGGGAAPSGSASSTVYGNGQFGTPSKPVDQMTMGEVVDFGNNTLIPNTRGKVGAGPDMGTSATGAYQITAGTYNDYAPKVFGADWKNIPNTQENQDKVAEAIYNDRNNGDLTQTWKGLSNLPGANVPGAFKDVPWSQARQMIAQGETGQRVPDATDPQSIPGVQRDNTTAQNTSQLLLNSRLAQNSTGLAADLSDSLNDTSTTQQVASKLRSSGDFKGTDNGFLVGEIQKIMQQTGYNAATAGAIMARNVRKSDSGTVGQVMRYLGNPLGNGDSTPNLANGIRLDDSGVRDDITKMKSSGFIPQVLQNQQNRAQAQVVSQAKAQADAALQQLQQLQVRVRSQPALAPLVQQYTQQAQAAQQAYQNALQQTAGNPSNIPMDADPTGARAQQANDAAVLTAAARRAQNEKENRSRITQNAAYLNALSQRP